MELRQQLPGKGVPKAVRREQHSWGHMMASLVQTGRSMWPRLYSFALVYL